MDIHNFSFSKDCEWSLFPYLFGHLETIPTISIAS